MRRRLTIALPIALVAALCCAQPASAAFGFVTKWGSNGTGNGQFKSPDDVATDQLGNVYTIELSGNRVQKFATNGAFIWKSGATGSGNGQFSTPAEVATDSNGRVWVAEQGNSRAQALSQGNGSYVTSWAAGSSPSGIAVDTASNVIVANAFGTVRKYTPAGVQIATYGSAGGGPDQYSLPTGVATDSANNVYIVDRGHNRVLKFGPGGGLTPIGKFGASGTSDGKFQDPTGIAVAPGGAIYVADRGNNRIQIFNANGAFVGKFGSTGTGNSQFSSPQGVAVDRSCNVFVADTGNNRIQKFGDSSGSCTGSTPNLDPKLLVCVGLWTSNCAGFPPPDPVLTCVSLWQDCTGFGGMPPGSPGTIDMSGFPSSIPAPVTCSSGGSASQALAHASQDNRGNGFNVLDELPCAIQTYLESDDPNAVKQAKSRVEYELNARHFKTEVSAARVRVANGLRAICQVKQSDDKQTCAVKNALELLIFDSVDEFFDYAEKPGQGVKGFAVNQSKVDGLCAKFEKPPLCKQVFTVLVGVVNGELNALNVRKHKLGLNKAFGAQGSSLSIAGSSIAYAAAKGKGKGGKKGKRKAWKRKGRIVLAAGLAQIAQGKQGQLRLKIPKATRKLLKKAKRKGVKKIRATAVLRATIVPGVTSTKRVKIKILLVKPKKKPAKGRGGKQKRRQQSGKS